MAATAKGSRTQADIITAFIGDDEIDRIYVGDDLIWYQFDPEALLAFYTPED